MNPEQAVQEPESAPKGKLLGLEPLSVAIRRFSVFDSDSDDASGDEERPSQRNEESEASHSGSDSANDSDSGSHAASGKSGHDASTSGVPQARQGPVASLKDDPETARDVPDAPRTGKEPSDSQADMPKPASQRTPTSTSSPPPGDNLSAAEAGRPAETTVSPQPAQQLRPPGPIPSSQAVPPTDAPGRNAPSGKPATLAHHPTSASRTPNTLKKQTPRNGSASGRKTIYERGLLQQRATEQRLEEIRTSLATRDVDGVTFQPTISALARRLHRSPDAVLRNCLDQEILRKRLQILEAPVEEEGAELTFSPRISARSEKIVRSCRASQQVALPAGERLYLDHLCREEAADESMGPSEPIRRSTSQIQSHIATLYAFEQRKRETVDAIREAQQTGPSPALYVDPNEVVERLTRPRVATASHEMGVLVRAEEAPGLPPITVVDKEMTDLARFRGLMRWFHYFSDGQPTLATHKLLDYDGLHTEVARTVAHVLLRTTVECDEWAPDTFLAAMDDAATRSGGGPELFFWRTRPITPTAQQREMTFHPQLNPTSERLAAKASATADRKGDTHERLFLAARLKQLQKQQTELERQQERLAEAEQEKERRAQCAQQWRKKSRSVLQQARDSNTINAAAVPPDSPVAAGTENSASCVADAPERSQRTRSTSAASPSPAANQAHSEHRGQRKKGRSTRRAGPTHTPVASAELTAPPATPAMTSTSLQLAVHELQSILDLGDHSEASGVIPCDVATERSLTPLSIHSEHEEDTESGHTNSSVPAAGRNRRVAGAAMATGVHATKGKSSLDFLLACAECRPPSTVCASERLQLEQENRRRLRRLGMQLYDQQW